MNVATIQSCVLMQKRIKMFCIAFNAWLNCMKQRTWRWIQNETECELLHAVIALVICFK